MHKKYIKYMEPIHVDYIPEDLQICSRCIFFEVCPYDYCCSTFNRVAEYENLVNDDTNERVE